jgi:low molecular weight phosphotyrosine protein phosphatase
MAEGVFRSLAGSHPRFGTIDSAGTGAYHTLEPPDSRTMDTLRKHGICDYDHSARKIQAEDFRSFDYILAMDASNLRDLQRAQQKVNSGSIRSKAKVMLFGEFSGNSKAEQVGDPYYGEDDGFEEVYEQVSRFSKRFLQEVVDKAPTTTQT